MLNIAFSPIFLYFFQDEANNNRFNNLLIQTFPSIFSLFLNTIVAILIFYDSKAARLNRVLIAVLTILDLEFGIVFFFINEVYIIIHNKAKPFGKNSISDQMK